jgi:two-component system alkaline phosphatase synthesis response regulator PhoP
MAQRILVVDDDRQIVRLLRGYLERAGYRVYVAYSGDEALRLWRLERPDLVVLDIMLPERDGWEVTRIVRGDATLQVTPIIMLTARVEDHDKVFGLELGADDYVTKPFNPGEVVARVRAILRRAQSEPARRKVIEAGPLSVDLDGHEVRVQGHPVQLTPTEFKLLRTMAENPDRALSRRELIETGLGYTYDGVDRTVDSHIRNLRSSLDKAGGDGLGTALVQTVFGVGYRLCSYPEWTRDGDR